MTKDHAAKQERITDRFIEAVCARLANNQRVRRTLPQWGRLHMDRQLPFLCVYRRPERDPVAASERLVTTEASYLFASAVRSQQRDLSRLVTEVARTLGAQFGAFLVLELWTGVTADDSNEAATSVSAPHFRILAPESDDVIPFVEKFAEFLMRIRIARRSSTVDLEWKSRCAPPDMAPIVPQRTARQLHCSVMGLEVRPIHADPTGGKVYPIVLRDLRRELTKALRQTFFEFVRTQTTQRPPHYHALGRRSMVKAVWEVDRKLAEVSDSFDFLLQTTPTNGARAWNHFRKEHFERAPVFRYRPLPVDPVALKRKLYATPLERMEDPTLIQLFREKQDELDRKLTMLNDLNTERFIHGSVQVFGGVSPDLQSLAEELLRRLPPRTRTSSRNGFVDAEGFAKRARSEFETFKKHLPDIKARVRIRDDIVSTMVSRGSLLVRKGTRIPRNRVSAILQHEVGTHVLTYWNGRAQPFRQLYSGLAGYEATQEGLAVLAEYLVGGLNRRRLRQLAARVVAAKCLISGATFVETFRTLDRTYEFDQSTAFDVTMRTFRGGGLTKDAVYLGGLVRLLEYFKRGGELEPLLVGKLAFQHVPLIKELQWRKVLRPTPLRPTYLDAPDTAARLKLVREGLTVMDLANSARS